MFSRLMKYEWRANAPLFGILSLAVCGIGVAATLVLRLLVSDRVTSSYDESVFGVILPLMMGVFLVFCAIAVCVYLVAIQVLSLYRFYKHKFTDEGYLTFTLPVTVPQIFWSSFLSMLLWLVISVAVAAGVVALVVLVGKARGTLINTALLHELAQMLPIIFEDLIPLGEVIPASYLVAMGLQALVAPFYALFIPMACITIGAVLAKKHKILASFGIYYGVNFVIGNLSSVASIFPMLFLPDGGVLSYYTVSAYLELALTAAMTVAAYFLTTYLMKHRLNLS